MLPGVVGLIQATEVIKLILENGVPLKGRLLLYDAMKMNFKELCKRMVQLLVHILHQKLITQEPNV